MAGTIRLEEKLTIPLEIHSLADFRKWICSPSAPESGRIDYIGGNIEVDMAPEDLFSHGTLKGKLYAVLLGIVEAGDRGALFVDRTRVCVESADLSVEPDIVYVSRQSLETGVVRLVPKEGFEDRFIELDGPPDLVVEVVSDASVSKDTKRLPAAYFAAGVTEFWLVDARSEELVFSIDQRGASGFEAVRPDEEGYQTSGVMGCAFQLVRERRWLNLWQYDLLTKPIT